MSYSATVYKVLIASPGDVTAERKNIPDVIWTWNATHSEDIEVVLLPVMWETHSTPEMGERPQAIINRQLVASCDILIGAFWTRIGTHTGVSESGTVEEIERFIKAGKPVLLYFSSLPVRPESVDPEQYSRLNSFKTKCEKEGLIQQYNDISELREKLSRHLTSVVRKLRGELSLAETETDNPVHFVRSAKEQLQALITRAEVDWSTERDGKPMTIEDGIHISKRLASDLLDFRASLQGRVGGDTIKDLDAQISELKKLQDYIVRMDGGKSYQEFWDRGDEVFKILQGIPGAFKPAPTQVVGGLEEEKVKILRLLAKSEESGIEELEDTSVAGALNISLTVVRYHLEELEIQEYIYGSYAIGRPALYSLNQKGREYLIGNTLI